MHNIQQNDQHAQQVPYAAISTMSLLLWATPCQKLGSRVLSNPHHHHSSSSWWWLLIQLLPAFKCSSAGPLQHRSADSEQDSAEWWHPCLAALGNEGHWLYLVSRTELMLQIMNAGAAKSHRPENTPENLWYCSGYLSRQNVNRRWELLILSRISYNLELR